MDPDFEEDPMPVDEEVQEACEVLRNRSLLQRCDTCGRHRGKHFFSSPAANQCIQCAKSWTPRGIAYQDENLKVVHGRTPTRLLGIHHNMWLDTKAQRRKVIDAAIEVAAYPYKNENLRIDQRLKVISMCLPSLFSFSAPLIDWPEADLKILTSVWVRAYKNAWNLTRGTATCLFTYPREQGGLQVKLPLGTLFSSIWGNLERCSQFDDGTRQMLELTYREALSDNGCQDLLELQDVAQHLGWKRASTNEITFACYLASKLEIRVDWDPFNPDLIASAPNTTLATLACQVKLLVLIQVEGAMVNATCLRMGPDDTIVIGAGTSQHTIQVDGQARNPGLPSLRECISRSYGQAQWLYELPGMANDPDSEERAEGHWTLPTSSKYRGVGLDTDRSGPPHTITTVHAGSAADRNRCIFIGDTITQVDSVSTSAMNHAEMHLAMQGLEYTPVTLGVLDSEGKNQNLTIMRSPPKTPLVSWARALKPLRDRRKTLEGITTGLNTDEAAELAALLQGEAAFVRLWPKLRYNS